MDAKQHHFEAAAQYRKSMGDLEANIYGHELARLKEARAIAKQTYEKVRRSAVSRPVVNDIKVRNVFLLVTQTASDAAQSLSPTF